MNGITLATRHRRTRLLILTTAVSIALSAGAFAGEPSKMHDPSSDGHNWATLPTSVHAQAQAKAQPQTLCPVTGEKVDRSQYVDYEGKRVYFCCAPCKQTFAKAPEKYLGETESKGIVLQRVFSPPKPPTTARDGDHDSHTQGSGCMH